MAHPTYSVQTVHQTDSESRRGKGGRTRATAADRPAVPVGAGGAGSGSDARAEEKKGGRVARVPLAVSIVPK
jgi:hypothetical protein